VAVFTSADEGLDGEAEAPEPTVREAGGHAYTLALPHVERLERLIMCVDARRDRALHALAQFRERNSAPEAA
jgi:hypothetical protein